MCRIATAFLSAWLDNVTTMLLICPGEGRHVAFGMLWLWAVRAGPPPLPLDDSLLV